MAPWGGPSGPLSASGRIWHAAVMSPLFLAQDPAADEFLASDPLALLIAMLLDQQVPMEKAFSSPYQLSLRLGHAPTAAELLQRYDGDAAEVWRGAATGKDLIGRLGELPGFGAYKAQITVALLGKQLGVRPDGWREAAGRFGEEGSYYSVADIVDDASLAAVRAHKKQMKAAAKADGKL